MKQVGTKAIDLTKGILLELKQVFESNVVVSNLGNMHSWKARTFLGMHPVWMFFTHINLTKLLNAHYPNSTLLRVVETLWVRLT